MSKLSRKRSAVALRADRTAALPKLTWRKSTRGVPSPGYRIFGKARAELVAPLPRTIATR